MKSFVWILFAALYAFLPIVASGQQLKQGDRPNVLFIAIDDLNDWIGCMNAHPGVKSPNLDRLAKQGMLFTRAYATVPACNPSRVSLLTGLRPSTSGIYGNRNPFRPTLPDVVTLPQHFKESGYLSVGSGKIYHAREGYGDPKSWHEFVERGDDPRPSREVRQDPKQRSGGIVWGPLDVDDSQMDDYKMVTYAIDQLNAEHDKPFFLACGIYRPHMPWQVPRKYYDMFPLDSIELPKVKEDDLDDVPPAGRRMAWRHDHKTMLETGNWKRAVQGYLASIAFADAQVGRLLDALDKSRYADNTIVVLWSDHGWHHGQKEHWRKFHLWEQATRSVLMIRSPGVTPPGSVCQRSIEFIHIYPTLADLCELPIPDHLEGTSFAHLLKDPKGKWDRPAIMTHGRNNHAVRSERWRYIRYQNGDEELYDHDNDPLEWKNLAGDPKFDDVKRELAKWIPEKNVPEAPREDQ